MSNGNHARSTGRRSRRPLVLILSVALILALAIGGTVAYLATKTDPVENIFTPTEVSCYVDAASDMTNVRVQNTGNIDAYIRVYVVANYVNNKDYVCAAHSVTAPTPANGWVAGEGGYYYYNTPVKSGEYTPYLFAAHSLAATEADGCKLQLEVIASAIQTSTGAVSAWKGA